MDADHPLIAELRFVAKIHLDIIFKPMVLPAPGGFAFDFLSKWTYNIPSLTVKARRLPLIQAFYGLFDCAKCSYILLLFCLGCPNDFPHINI